MYRSVHSRSARSRILLSPHVTSVVSKLRQQAISLKVLPSVAVAIALLVALAAQVLSGRTPAGASSSAGAMQVDRYRQVDPHVITGAYPQARQGTLPPGNPSANIPPDPNFLQDCSGTSIDTSESCAQATLQAIANARSDEGVPPMELPTDWGQLDPAEQLFVATNLERTARGIPPLSEMVSSLDQAAGQGASSNSDPEPPGGFPYSQWTSNWAGGVGSPLEAIYYWMYDDGPGSPNADCSQAGDAGCWGHRDNILNDFSCQPCVIGAAVDGTAWQGSPSWAELMVDTSGDPQGELTWSAVLPYLPGGDGGAGLYSTVSGMAPTGDGGGYWLVSSNGGIFTFGNAGFFDSMSGRPLSKPIVGVAPTPDGQGYWLVATDGGIFSFGDASFHGSMGGKYLAAPIVGMAPTPDGQGYWEVASDGGVFSFGDASFHGSMGGRALSEPIVGLASTPDGQGYWEVASDGGIFSFGDASFHGSTGSQQLVRPVSGMARGQGGYWLVATDGGIFSFGVPFYGSMG